MYIVKCMCRKATHGPARGWGIAAVLHAGVRSNKRAADWLKTRCLVRNARPGTSIEKVTSVAKNSSYTLAWLHAKLSRFSTAWLQRGVAVWRTMNTITATLKYIIVASLHLTIRWHCMLLFYFWFWHPSETACSPSFNMHESYSPLSHTTSIGAVTVPRGTPWTKIARPPLYIRCHQKKKGGIKFIVSTD